MAIFRQLKSLQWILKNVTPYFARLVKKQPILAAILALILGASDIKSENQNYISDKYI